MDPALFQLSENDRDRLRVMISAIERQVFCLSHEDTAENHRIATSSLTSSWAALVELLAVGPAPALRACPVCQYMARREATRCGHCWTVLTPVQGPLD